MAINIERYSGLPPASERQRQQTDARQDRWMSQLEHAMLQSAKKPAAPPGAQDAGPPEQPALSARQPRQSRQPQASEQAATAAAAPAQPARLAALAHVDDAAAKMPGETVTGAASSEAITPQGGAATSHAPAAMSARGMGGATQAPVGGAGADIPAAYSVASAALLTAAPVAARMLATLAPESAATSTASVAGKAPAGAGWLAAGMDVASEAAPAVAEQTDAAPEQTEAQVHSGDEQQYSERRLHIYRDAEGVQAWLRDASLGQAQVQQLARAMAGELGSTGAPLTALTVNGRRQPLLTPATGAAQRDDYTADAGADAPATPYTLYQNGAI